MKRFLLLPILLTSPLGAGEPRTWTSADGTRHFEAEFVSREKDSVTLLRSDGKSLSVEVGKLHADDQRWLNRNHPADGSGPVPDADAVFDTLKFGDDRDAVARKLQASKLVEAGLDGTFFGRTGLNGVYRTRHKIGGMHCHLSFDWDENGGLKESDSRGNLPPGGALRRFSPFSVSPPDRRGSENRVGPRRGCQRLPPLRDP